MAINAGPKQLAVQSKNMAKFSNLLSVKLIRGDIFTIDRLADTMVVSLNGETLGTIQDPSLFDLLIRTWIGRVPLSSDFRAALLSNGKIDRKLLAQFESTVPSEERIIAIASGLESKRGNRMRQSALSSGPTIPIARVTPPPKKTAPRPAAPPLKTITYVDNTNIEDESLASTSKQVDDGSIITTPKLNVTRIEKEKKPPVVAAESIFEEEDDEEEFTAASLLEQQLYVARLKKMVSKTSTLP